MAMKVRCPTCRKTFPWDFTAAGGWPDICPIRECQSRIGGDRADDDIVLPFISTSGKTKATDKVYRDMERGSEVRAEAAREMTGASAEEVSGLKITDLKPTTHAGDIAAPPLPAHLQHVGGFKGNGAEFAAGISTGDVTLNDKVVGHVAPRAGITAQTAIQRQLRGF